MTIEIRCDQDVDALTITLNQNVSVEESDETKPRRNRINRNTECLCAYFTNRPPAGYDSASAIAAETYE